jgi:hypothetical protein
MHLPTNSHACDWDSPFFYSQVDPKAQSHTHTHTHTRVRTHTHTHTHTCAHTHTHTCKLAPPQWWGSGLLWSENRTYLVSIWSREMAKWWPHLTLMAALCEGIFRFGSIQTVARLHRTREIDIWLKEYEPPSDFFRSHGWDWSLIQTSASPSSQLVVELKHCAWSPLVWGSRLASWALY